MELHRKLDSQSCCITKRGTQQRDVKLKSLRCGYAAHGTVFECSLEIYLHIRKKITLLRLSKCSIYFPAENNKRTFAKTFSCIFLFITPTRFGHSGSRTVRIRAIHPLLHKTTHPSHWARLTPLRGCSRPKTSHKQYNHKHYLTKF